MEYTIIFLVNIIRFSFLFLPLVPQLYSMFYLLSFIILLYSNLNICFYIFCVSYGGDYNCISLCSPELYNDNKAEPWLSRILGPFDPISMDCYSIKMPNKARKHWYFINDYLVPISVTVSHDSKAACTIPWKWLP